MVFNVRLWDKSMNTTPCLQIIECLWSGKEIILQCWRLFLLELRWDTTLREFGFLLFMDKNRLKELSLTWKKIVWNWDYYYLHCPSECFQSIESWSPVYFSWTDIVELFIFHIIGYCSAPLDSSGTLHFSSLWNIFIWVRCSLNSPFGSKSFWFLPLWRFNLK